MGHPSVNDVHPLGQTQPANMSSTATLHNTRYQFSSPSGWAIYPLHGTLGVVASLQETSENWSGVYGYLLYQGARLAWDPFLDLELLKRDYYANLYGAAAEPVKKYVDLLCGVFCDASKKKRMGYGGYPALSRGDADQSLRLLDEAERLAGDNPRVVAAVRAMRRGFEYVDVWSQLLDNYRRLSAFAVAGGL